MYEPINDQMTPYIGLQADRQAMPTDGLHNGTSFYEMDQNVIKFWDAQNKQWVPTD